MHVRACLLKPLQARISFLIPFLCSASLFRDAHVFRDPARADSVRFSLRLDGTLTLLILKNLRKVGWVPPRLAQTVCVGPPLSGRMLTQITLDSDSSMDYARRADLYLHQNTDLCPLFHSVPFSLNNGELACPPVCCSANTTSLTHSACVWLCHFVFMPVCFPDVSFHTLQIRPYTRLLEVCVCVCICVGC